MILKPEKTRVIQCDLGVLKINEKLVSDKFLAPKKVSSWIEKGDKMKPCKAIKKLKGVTIHNTNEITVSTDTTMSEQYTRATYNGNMNGSMVHYYVDDVEAWQLLREDEQGWHAGDGSGDGNSCTISIEGIGEDSLDNVALLTAHLCVQHNLNPEKDVYTHKHWSGKWCPEYFLKDWDNFIAVVIDYYNSMKKIVNTDFTEAREWVIKNKISDGTRPKDFVTREELWTILYRSSKK